MCCNAEVPLHGPPTCSSRSACTKQWPYPESHFAVLGLTEGTPRGTHDAFSAPSCEESGWWPQTQTRLSSASSALAMAPGHLLVKLFPPMLLPLSFVPQRKMRRRCPYALGHSSTSGREMKVSVKSGKECEEAALTRRRREREAKGEQDTDRVKCPVRASMNSRRASALRASSRFRRTLVAQAVSVPCCSRSVPTPRSNAQIIHMVQPFNACAWYFWQRLRFSLFSICSLCMSLWLQMTATLFLSAARRPCRPSQYPATSWQLRPPPRQVESNFTSRLEGNSEPSAHPVANQRCSGQRLHPGNWQPMRNRCEKVKASNGGTCTAFCCCSNVRPCSRLRRHDRCYIESLICYIY